MKSSSRKRPWKTTKSNKSSIVLVSISNCNIITSAAILIIFIIKAIKVLSKKKISKIITKSNCYAGNVLVVVERLFHSVAPR